MIGRNKCGIFGAKEKIPASELVEYVSKFEVLQMGAEEKTWAISIFNGVDFEDTLQIACALHHKCEKFVTLDRKLKNKYKSLLNIDLV